MYRSKEKLDMVFSIQFYSSNLYDYVQRIFVKITVMKAISLQSWI